MKRCLREIGGELERFFSNQPLVLVDIGASGTPPETWRELSLFSCYVGFDPDLRELSADNRFGFRRFVVFNKAVTEKDQKELPIYLTAYPYCSSTLKPNSNNIRHYSFSELFRVEKTSTVQAIRLDSALREIGLEYVDWLKVDSQGKDLDIIRSLDARMSDRLLVLDIEPGVTDFYEGENTFSQAHEYLMMREFWLSGARLQQFPRISSATREKLASRKIDFDRLPASPTAVEAQYCRTLEHLVSKQASLRDHVCFWIFSMMNSTYGFALDIALQTATLYPNDSIGDLLAAQTLAVIERTSGSRDNRFRSALKAWIPNALHPLALKLWKLIAGTGARS